MCALAQSCSDWSNLFSERRSIGGGFYLTHSDGERPHYYLMEQGRGGTVAGPLTAIGWSRDFVLIQDAAHPGIWTVIDIRSGRSRVPKDPVQAQQFAQKLGRFIEPHTPQEAWESAGS